MTDTIKRPWRSILKIHPAAELFPQLPADELRALGDDIKAHGTQTPITFWVPADCQPVYGAKDLAKVYLLDGRNRLDACEAVGLAVFDDAGQPAKFVHFSYWFEEDEIASHRPSITDPYDFVISANILRRHLTTAKKHELIEKLLKENPQRSNRQIAELVKVSDKTVAGDREKLEATAEIPQLNRTIGRDGKARPRGRVGHMIERAGEAAAKAGLSLDEYIGTLSGPGEKTPRPAEPYSFYTANPDADLDPGETAAASGSNAALPALPRSRSLTPVMPPANIPVNLISPDEIKAKLGPLVDELLAEIPALGTLSKARHLARKVQRQIAQWSTPCNPNGAEGGAELLAAIVKHPRRAPAGFLSNLARIIDAERPRLVEISASIRIDAICKIMSAFGFEPSATSFRYIHEVSQRQTIQ